MFGTFRESKERILALTCLLLIGCLMACGPSRRSAREGGPDPALVATPRCEVSPRTVTISFRSSIPLRSRVVAGYRPEGLGTVEASTSRADTRHDLTLRSLAAGRLFYRVELLPDRGAPIASRVYNVLIPGDDGTVPSQVYGARGPSRTAPSLPRRKTQAVTIAALRGERAEERPAPDSSYDPPLEGKAVGKANAFSAGAYEIGYEFGPGTLKPERRLELKKEIAGLEAEYQIEPRAETALALGRAYLRLQGDMQALKYLKKAIDADPSLFEAHRLRLAYFKKYGMGWKIQETYAAMCALRPGDTQLKAAALGDAKRYGSHRWLGEPVKVRIGERATRLGIPPWEKEKESR